MQTHPNVKKQYILQLQHMKPWEKPLHLQKCYVLELEEIFVTPLIIIVAKDFKWLSLRRQVIKISSVVSVLNCAYWVKSAKCAHFLIQLWKIWKFCGSETLKIVSVRVNVNY